MTFKRVVFWCILPVMFWAVCGCGVSAGNPKNEQTVPTVGKETEESDGKKVTVNVGEEPVKDIDEVILRELLDKNKEYYWYWQSLGMLTSDVCLGGDFYQVDTSYFKNWSEFEKAISQVYCKTMTEKLLYADDKWLGTPLYKNFDGKIGKNDNFMSNRGTLVTWENYKVRIIDAKDDKCNFEVILKADYPGCSDNEEIILNKEVIFEDGKWKLTDMFFDNAGE